MSEETIQNILNALELAPGEINRQVLIAWCRNVAREALRLQATVAQLREALQRVECERDGYRKAEELLRAGRKKG